MRNINRLVVEADNFPLKVVKMQNFVFSPWQPWWWEVESFYLLRLERSVILQRRKGNSQSLTILGWIILGTAHCELLHLSTAPPPPVHPEIRMIHGYQTVIIPCFWKRLAPVEELFPGASIKGYQWDSSRLDPAISWSEQYMLDLGIIGSGSCLALCSLYVPGWIPLSSSSASPLCNENVSLDQWVQRRCPRAPGRSEWEGFLPLHLSHLQPQEFCFIRSIWAGLKWDFGRGKTKEVLLLKKRSMRNGDLDRPSQMFFPALTSCE